MCGPARRGGAARKGYPPPQGFEHLGSLMHHLWCVGCGMVVAIHPVGCLVALRRGFAGCRFRAGPAQPSALALSPGPSCVRALSVRVFSTPGG